MDSAGEYDSYDGAYYDVEDYDYGYDESYDYEMSDSVTADYDEEYVSEGQSSGLQTVQEENPGAKLIRSVSISFDTEQFDDAVTLVEQKTSQTGGYIQSSELYDYSYGRSQEIVVRVPYEKVDEFLDGIDAYGTITHKSDSVEDVTLQYSDVETRIENLETQHQRLLELLEQAEDLEDIIILNDKLTSVETQLDSYQKQIRNYDNLVNYSTITFSIQEREYVIQTEDRTIWGRITSGLSETMYNIGTFFSNLLVWFVVSLPVLLIIAVFIAVIVLIIRAIVKAIIRKHKKKSEEK
jgi:hypothetical protein